MSLKQEMAAQYPAKEGFKVKAGMATTATSSQKWRSALVLAVIFAVLSSPMLYKLSDGLARKYLGEKYAVCHENGCPTTFGMIISAVMFLIVMRILMA